MADPFLADPFIALQTDLEDVSEVIKHNLEADRLSSSASSAPLSHASSHRSSPHHHHHHHHHDHPAMANSSTTSCSSSPAAQKAAQGQQQSDRMQIGRHCLAEHNGNGMPPAALSVEHQQEIDQIVHHLLQPAAPPAAHSAALNCPSPLSPTAALLQDNATSASEGIGTDYLNTDSACGLAPVAAASFWVTPFALDCLQQEEDPMIGGTSQQMSPSSPAALLLAEQSQHHFGHLNSMAMEHQQDFVCEMDGGLVHQQQQPTALDGHFIAGEERRKRHQRPGTTIPFPSTLLEESPVAVTANDGRWRGQQAKESAIPMGPLSPPPTTLIEARAIKQELLVSNSTLHHELVDPPPAETEMAEGNPPAQASEAITTMAGSRTGTGIGMGIGMGMGSTEAAVRAKNELIRMLLEMSPEELEHLRVSRAHEHQQRGFQPPHPHPPLYHQQHLPYLLPAMGNVGPLPPLPAGTFLHSAHHPPLLHSSSSAAAAEQLVLQHHQHQLLLQHGNSPPLDPPPPPSFGPAQPNFMGQQVMVDFGAAGQQYHQLHHHQHNQALMPQQQHQLMATLTSATMAPQHQFLDYAGGVGEAAAASGDGTPLPRQQPHFLHLQPIHLNHNLHPSPNNSFCSPNSSSSCSFPSPNSLLMDNGTGGAAMMAAAAFPSSAPSFPAHGGDFMMEGEDEDYGHFGASPTMAQEMGDQQQRQQEEGEEEEEEGQLMWTMGAEGNGNGEEEEGNVEGRGGGKQQQKGGRRQKAAVHQKTERRTAHNLIEKKYRCSINDRINQLKEMLASERGAKLSKSATLRRAVDHILALRAKNMELAGENRRLRHAFESAGVALPPIQQNQRTTTTIMEMGMGVLKTETANGQQKHNGGKNKGTTAIQIQARGRAASARKVASAASAAESASAAADGPPTRGDHSRVTLCVFMFLLLAFNPLAMFLASDAGGHQQPAQSMLFEHRPPMMDLDEQQQEQHMLHHRTLAEDARFTVQFAEGALPPPLSSSPSPPPPSSSPSPPPPSSSSVLPLWLSSSSPLVRHTLIWLLNCIFVYAILNRLLVSGEPVADRRSPRWNSFLLSRDSAAQAVAAGNWKEAQRVLGHSLQLLDRPLPSAGSLDEWMSLVWQIIRHLLNGLWIGRWFARRRRPLVQSQKSVCRSHAATAMVYHQLHQLHLIGIDGIGLSQRGALNLALLAANLAESAGSTAISHALRAEIYVCAAFRCRLCLPHWLRRIVAAYFFRRAKRHVRKSARLDGTQLNSLQWLFHPLARQFLASPEHLAAILGSSGSKRTPNFPLSNSAQSPKPVHVLQESFKMHLLDSLLSQLHSGDGRPLRVADFVDQSQLLLQMCSRGDKESGGQKRGEEQRAQALPDLLLLSSAAGDGHDPVCAWWTRLLSAALHWRHGDLIRARQHWTVVRQCPSELGGNNLALAVGLAFCARKICLEDRTKWAWVEMVQLHCQRSFLHLRRTDSRHCQWREGDEGDNNEKIQAHLRVLSCQWLLSSLLDLCAFSALVSPDGTTLPPPDAIRRLYRMVMARLENDREQSQRHMDERKLAMFKHLGQAFCGQAVEGGGAGGRKEITETRAMKSMELKNC